MSNQGWIGVDLDGTLAEYHGWQGADHIGQVIGPMAARVRRWLLEGKDVRIFTARVSTDGTPPRDLEARMAQHAIELWCLNNLGRVLPITNVKDYGMAVLYDDRAITVEQNTGKLIGVEQGRFS